MNCEETLTLLRLGKSAWEGWERGLMAKKDELRATGKWSADGYGEGQNEETKAWFQEATADFSKAVFESDADFAGLNFPGPANFDGAQFAVSANFAGATFTDNVSFDRARFAGGSFASARFFGLATFVKTRFDGHGDFAKAEFLRVCDFAPCACFRYAQFDGAAEFAGAQFAGTAEFPKTVFSATQFDLCEFRGDTLFTSAQFTGTAGFVRTRFSGARVDFENAVFSDEASFTEAHFGGSWAGLVISGAGCVSFEAARFEKDALFRKTWFVGESQFKGALFKGAAAFEGALFVMPASFAPAVFSAGASFMDAQFEHKADFAEAQFLGECEFSGVKFAAEARFAKARFVGAAQFARAQFLGAADFCGVAAEAALVVDGAKCATAPNFAEGSFAQTLALDKLVLVKPRRRLFRWLRRQWGTERPPIALRVTEALPPAPREKAPPAEATQTIVRPPIITLRTSAAVAIAASAKNHEEPEKAEGAGDRQAEEEAAATMAIADERDSAHLGTVVKEDAESTVCPLRGPETGSAPPASAPPLIAPLCAGRRSMAQPLLAWIFMIMVFTPFYLSQRPAGPYHAGAPVQGGASPSATVPDTLGSRARAAFDALSNRSCVHGQSDPAAEALFLSAKNALIFIPWENEHVMRRAYGCLYGMEAAAPVIPVTVSLGSLLQAALSLALLVKAFFPPAGRMKGK